MTFSELIQFSLHLLAILLSMCLFIFLCVFAAYQLTHRLKVKNLLIALLLGPVFVPAALCILPLAGLQLMHYGIFTQVLWHLFIGSGIVGGYIGSGAARLNNLKQGYSNENTLLADRPKSRR